MHSITAKEAQICFELGIGYTGFLRTGSEREYNKLLQSVKSLNLKVTDFSGKDEALQYFRSNPATMTESLAATGIPEQTALFHLGGRAIEFLFNVSQGIMITEEQRKSFLGLYEQLGLNRAIGEDYLSLVTAFNGTKTLPALLGQSFELFQTHLVAILKTRFG